MEQEYKLRLQILKENPLELMNHGLMKIIGKHILVMDKIRYQTHNYL